MKPEILYTTDSFEKIVAVIQDMVTDSYPTERAAMTLLLFWSVIIPLYYLPDVKQYGPPTPTGHIPSYQDNGMKHVALFTSMFLLGAYKGLYSLSILFDEHMAMLAILNIGAMMFCLYLYYKGNSHPSTRDVTFSDRGFLYDFFTGIELYPNVLGVDVKKIVNCRFSMTFWMVYGISATAASYSLHGELDYGLLACSALTYVYLFKFFWWEIGYMRSIDIIEDNCGFMETWGCLVFVPSMYTNHMTCAVKVPSGLSPS
jgi:7-dehydrocholesterol reductase